MEPKRAQDLHDSEKIIRSNSSDLTKAQDVKLPVYPSQIPGAQDALALDQTESIEKTELHDLVQAPFDIPALVEKLQTLVNAIQKNLENNEQHELERLLAEGAKLLANEGMQIRTMAENQFGQIKRDIQTNPYHALLSALKIGMAISQVYASMKLGNNPDGTQAKEVPMA